MLELIRHAPATDTGPLDLGFRPEAFADDPPVNPTAGSDADTPVYGPANTLDFEAFRNSEDGHRATAQMKRCIDTISGFARDRNQGATAANIDRLHRVLANGATDALQSHYLPSLYVDGKRALEQIAAMLDRLEDHGDPRERHALQCLTELGKGIADYCGSRILGELTDANDDLSQIGDGMKISVRRVCRNTAKVAMMGALADSGSASTRYLADSHLRPQFEVQVGLPWARAPAHDPYFSAPLDLPQRVGECRSAVRKAVTPASVARTLAKECLLKVRTDLLKKTGGATTLGHQEWSALKAVVRTAGREFGPLRPEHFVRGDGDSDPMTVTDDPNAVLLDIRQNLVTERLVDDRRDVTLWREEADGTRWELVLKQGDTPMVVEDDGDGPQERTPLTADLVRAIASGALEDPCAEPRLDPDIRRWLIDDAIAAQTAAPADWDMALLAAPGVLFRVCEPLSDEALARLLGGIVGRPDAAGSGLARFALDLAVQRKLSALFIDVIDAMDVADLRAAWPRILPQLAGALADGNDALADAGLAALDRLGTPAAMPGWRSCRRALHEWRRGMQAWLIGAPTMPPWPDAALQRLGALHREGLLSGSVITTLLQGDAHLGVFVDRIGARPDPTRRSPFLACLTRACNELGLPPQDIGRLLPTERGLSGPIPDNGLEATAPRFWRLPAAQLEEALIYRARQGYCSVEDIVCLLRQFLDNPNSLIAPFSWQGSLRVIKQLSSDGVLSHSDCVGLLTNALTSNDWRFDWRREMLESINLPALRDYLDVVEHLAVKHGDQVDVDDLLHVCVDGGDPNRPRAMRFTGRMRSLPPGIAAQTGRIPLTSYDPQLYAVFGPSFHLALDFAMKAARHGWITSSQLSSHLAAGGAWTGDSVLPLLLDAEPEEDPLIKEDEAYKQAHLRTWLSHLVAAERGRALSGAGLVALLSTRHGPRQLTPMHLAMTQGSVSQLSIFLDWLVTATEPGNALKLRLVQLLQGGVAPGEVHVAFDTLQLGRYESLKAWLSGIRQLRAAGRLSNAQYVTLLVPDGDGDRRAIDAVAHAQARASAPQARTLVCAKLLREAALEGQALGWIAADEVQEILDPLTEAGLIG
jgi:hypothetical protein